MKNRYVIKLSILIIFAVFSIMFFKALNDQSAPSAAKKAIAVIDNKGVRSFFEFSLSGK
jgi:hypothetical protein